MQQSLKKIIEGYHQFRQKYAIGDNSIMEHLANHGQKPEIMVIACCDSRVDPALILQCDPGEIFTVRNVANVVPPYELDSGHHGTSAALEFAVCYLNIKHIIILGHSHCGGIEALMNSKNLKQNDFITRWVSLTNCDIDTEEVDTVAKCALSYSYQNCLSFPWIKERLDNKLLAIHQWFFDIKEGEIFAYSYKNNCYEPLSEIYHM